MVMTRRRTLAVLGGVLAVGVAAIVILFLLKKGPFQPTISPHRAGFVAQNWRFHLRPLDPEKAPDRLAAERIWRDLFPGMAKDPATRDLLRRLHGDLPVEFVAVDEKAAADKAVMMAPPGEGFAFAFRVGDLRTFPKETEAGEIWFRDIAFGHAILIKDAVAPNAAEGLEGPSPDEALALAMQDYMLRHAEDWVIGGPHFERDFKAPAPAAERRADLDRRIQEYADSARAFYGGLRTPKSWFR
jgi:hypothetical protein